MVGGQVIEARRHQAEPHPVKMRLSTVIRRYLPILFAGAIVSLSHPSFYLFLKGWEVGDVLCEESFLDNPLTLHSYFSTCRRGE